MSLLENIKIFLRKKTFGRFFAPPPNSLDLRFEFASYFLSDAIDLRVKAAKPTAATAEAVRTKIVNEYKEKLDAEIKQELISPQLNADTRAILNRLLAEAQLLHKIEDSYCQSPDALTQSLWVPWQLQAGWKTQFEMQLFLGLLMRAIQQVALNIVRTEYPLKLPPTPVPDDVQAAIQRILVRIEKVSRLFSPPLQIKSAQTAETELRVLVARNSGSACLPLRPIPSSPLSRDDFSKAFAGQPDEEMLNLSRQIRHADGTILVTGYRGVGKSSFVNRVLYEALGAQDTFPDDEWLLVPVTVNLAKVSGVQNILRLTIRALREALLEPESSTPKPIPSRTPASTKPIPLPLKLEEEIEALHEAYIRATYKVTMGASTVSQKSREIGSSFSFDPGKVIGPFAFLQLGNFLSGGIKKTKVEKISRELNLLDYDENAAEDDLGRLIRSLAQPRPLSKKDSRQVRIKLVFVFDELDKMDVETGLKPMIEGLKNLFLQQYAVFILVTSKKFYYDLLKDRAIEDAMLNSYFSAIVNVPLLQFSEAREIVKNWVFWESTDQLTTASPNELKLIEQFTRVLVYRSFGNPRDMIRELRLMQKWGDTQQPYVTDQGKNSTALQIFAGIQDCIEKTAGHSSTTAKGPGSAAPLVSDRLVGDESRLEQIRRGLYILVEELINRQKLTITTPQPAANGTGPTPSTALPTTGITATNTQLPAGVDQQPNQAEPAAVGNEIQAAQQIERVISSAKTTAASNSNSDKTFSEAIQELARLIRPKPTADLSVLEKIHRDNFSLVSLEDVQALAKRLGDFLDGLHRVLFPNDSNPTPLFTFKNEELTVQQEFYDLTGRQALTPTGQARREPVRKIDAKDAIALATHRISLQTWPDKMSAVEAIRELKPEEVPPELQKWLIETAQSAPSVDDRLTAAQLISPAFLFNNKTINLSDLLKQQTDDRVLSVYMNRLREANSNEEKELATEAILSLLSSESSRPLMRKLTDDSANTAFTVLPVVARAKPVAQVPLIPGSPVVSKEEAGQVTKQVLKWLTMVSASDGVRRTAWTALTTIASKENVDLVDCILADKTALGILVSGNTIFDPVIVGKETELKKSFRELLRARPLENAHKLLEAENVEVSQSGELLIDLYTAALESRDPNLTTHILDELQKQRQSQTLAILKLRDALGDMPDFNARLFPLLQDRLRSLPVGSDFSEEDRKDLSIELELAKKRAEDKPERLKSKEQPFTDRFTWQQIATAAIPGYKPFQVVNPIFQNIPSRVSISWDGDRMFRISLVGLALLIPGFVFFKGDLPASAGVGTTLLSRLILFSIDLTVIFPLIATYEYFGDDVMKRAQSSWALDWLMNPVYSFFIMMGVINLLVRAHLRMVGPLTWKNQVLQFLINLPAIALLFYGYTSSRSERTYGGIY